MIKAIAFDIGGVLMLGDYSVHPNRKGQRSQGLHEQMASKLKIDMDSWFDAIGPVYAKTITGEIPEKRSIKEMAYNLDVSPKKLENMWVKIIKKSFKFNRKLFTYALKLKKEGYKIAILSDQFYISKKALADKKFIKYFSPVIISCDVGYRKPERMIYEITYKKLKLKPSEIIFIDNRDYNLKTAKKLGMNVVLFKNNKDTISKIDKIIKQNLKKK